MGTDVLEFVYLVCFFLGLGFAVLSALLAGVFSTHFDGPVHLDGGGVHGDGGGVHSDGSEGTVHYSPWSPVTIAMLIATFGGTGLLYKKFLNPAPYVHLPLAAVSGIVVAGFLSWILYALMLRMQSTSQPRAGEAIGVEAEVTVAIPNGGVGEIAFTLRGGRLNAPARTVDDKELPAGRIVRIVRQTGPTYLVQKT